MNWDIMIVIILFILNIPVFKFIYRMFFSDPNEYNESVRYTFTPNIVSLFRGQYWKDKIGTARLQFFILLCLLVIFLEYTLVNKVIDYFS